MNQPAGSELKEEKRGPLTPEQRIRRHVALAGMKVDEKFLKVLKKIETRITEIESEGWSDFLQGIVNKLLTQINLLRKKPKDEQSQKAIREIEARITQIESATPQDVLRDIRSKLYAYLFLMRGSE